MAVSVELPSSDMPKDFASLEKKQPPGLELPSPKATKHFKDWPNSIGFNTVYEEREPVELEVKGHIPSWAAGTFFRTGAGASSIDTDRGTKFRVNHWFDNLSINHRFQIIPPESGDGSCRVIYNSRSTCDGLIEKIKKSGDRSGVTFGARYDPCKTLFQKFQSVFNTVSQKPSQYQHSEVSVAVTMTCNFPGLTKTGNAALADATHNRNKSSTTHLTLCNKTDANVLQMLDPETLEPIGIASQEILHPSLTGPLSSAHAEFDPVTGDVFNHNLSFEHGRGAYRVFTVSAATGKTSILASFDADPAYLHSFFLTEHYVVLCIWNAFFGHMGLDLIWKQNFVDALHYNGSKPARWYVIDRRPSAEGGRGIVATYDSDPFFCFHTVNAYEEEIVSKDKDGNETKKTDIIADLCTFPNLDILKRFYLENMMSDSESAIKFTDPKNETIRPSLWRFRLPSVASSFSPPGSLKPHKTPQPNHRRRSSNFSTLTSSLRSSLSSSSNAPNTQDNNSAAANGRSQSSTPNKKAPKFRAEIVHRIPSHTLALDLPTINPSYATRRHRYIYGISDRRDGDGDTFEEPTSTFVSSLVKYDCKTGDIKYWSSPGQTAGEAIFIPRPRPRPHGTRKPEGSEPVPDVHSQDQEGEGRGEQGGEQDEDDGILLTVVLDGHQEKSYLLVLDAKTMTEVGRADCRGVVGFGFHGTFSGRD